MPYALKEKQREFQRKWAAKKKGKERNLIERLGVPAKLSSAIVTWEQLQDGRHKVKEARDWTGCVKIAQGFIMSRKVNRLAVAELAIKASVIQHGGNMRSLDEDRPTLKKFAYECGIHHKTMIDWCRIKRQVVDLLPPDEKFIDWQAARLAMEDKSKTCKVKLYRRYSAADTGERNASLVMRYVRGLRTYLDTHGTKYLTSDEIVELFRNLRAMRAFSP